MAYCPKHGQYFEVLGCGNCKYEEYMREKAEQTKK